MKLISLSAKIHIPLIYHKHPFTQINIIDNFLDEKQTCSHIRKLAANKLLPFLQSANDLSERFGKHFKLALSVSGISLNLIEKYVPAVLDEVKLLVKKGTVEFLAEPWSNSVLPYFIQKNLTRQTELHRRTIEAIFGQLPSVFMADLPLNTENFSGVEPFPGCQTVLTCSNHLLQDRRSEKALYGKKANFLINYTLSQKLQQISSDNFNDTQSNQIVPFERYLRKYASLVKPLILEFDPLANNISAYKKWEEVITQLIKKTGVSFYSLSDLEEISNYFSIDNDYSEDMLSQFKQPDHWMKNKMQKEAFKQFRNIYKTIHINRYPYHPEAWDFLQDINNFFYMSDSFFIEEFEQQHFNPFNSPHEAFTNYMNAINNFWVISQKQKKPFIKTNFIVTRAVN